MEGLQNTANAVAQPVESVSIDDAAEQEQSRERIPIVWKGKAKEAASVSTTVKAQEVKDKQPKPEPKPLQRMKPNAAFLLNVVADAQRGNERLCAEEATNASLTVLGQAVSAGIRPQLERVQELGDKPMRAAVLSVAQQQKLASCTALLKEAAMVYGFALHIDPEVGEAASGGGVSSEPKDGYMLIQPLRVKLNVASKGDKAAVEEAMKVSYALPKHEAEPKSAARAPTVDVRANRLAGTAFGAIGLPGASQPPLAIRKLQRAKARQKDRSGIFAASDATPAESSHGEETAAHTDAEAAEDDENSGQEASDSMLEGAAGLSLPKEHSRKRPLSAPTQNGNLPLSSSRNETSSENGQHEWGPSRLPKPRAARAGSAQSLPTGLPSRQPSKMRMDEGNEADEEEQDEDSPEPDLAPSRLPKPQAALVGVVQGVPNGQPSKRPSRMRMDEGSEADVQQEDEGSPEPARKRLRSCVHQRGNPRADGSAAENGASHRYMPDADLSHEPDDVDAFLEEAQQQHSKQPVRVSLHADTAKANGQAGGLRSRLGSAATQGLSGAQRAANGDLRSEQGKQDATKKGSRSGRGLFGAALTGLQR